MPKTYTRITALDDGTWSDVIGIADVPATLESDDIESALQYGTWERTHETVTLPVYRLVRFDAEQVDGDGLPLLSVSNDHE